MVAGVVIPETPNGVPFTVIMVIFRSDPPELVSVTFEESFVPVVTDPKFTLLELGLSCGPAGVPVAAIVAVKFPASVCNVSVPLTPPEALPVKLIVRFAVEPATNEKGKVIPVTANCELLTLPALMLIGAVPVFLIDKACETFLPKVTDPKFKLDGVNWMEACCCTAFVPFSTPTHPLVNVSSVSVSSPRMPFKIFFSCFSCLF